MTMLMTECVRAFHERLGVSPRQAWQTYDTELQIMGRGLLTMAKDLNDRVASGDGDALRAHLLLEELGEFMTAETEEEALDGIIDLLYVLLGTIDMYDWPDETAFAEVHRANMTKTKSSGDELNNRVRDKGDTFEPPDMKGVLQRHRDGQVDRIRQAQTDAISHELHERFFRDRVVVESRTQRDLLQEIADNMDDEDVMLRLTNIKKDLDEKRQITQV